MGESVLTIGVSNPQGSISIIPVRHGDRTKFLGPTVYIMSRVNQRIGVANILTDWTR
jgi:hypothetical protein